MHQTLHFKRQRLNQLFAEAKKYPLILVCAGAGYGKTSAVHDFAQEYNATTIWIQLSERDNVSARFWENFTHSITQVNVPLAKALARLGFPDTRQKIEKYMNLLQDLVKLKQRIVVIDDCHCIEDPSVIRFLEECLILKMPPGTSVFLLSRSILRINTVGMVYRDMVVNINENDLRFTDDELTQYFHSLGINPKPEHLKEIMQDSGGWVFAINLTARSYQKAPGYEGYLRNAMKTNIFRLMETEIWEGISKRLQIFLIRLSMIDHLSVDLINLLAGTDKDLTIELDRQNAYVRRDSYINAYIIHPLFLKFLTAKQDLVSEEQRQETYAIAGAWCNKNDFKIDALTYYEKIDDYKSIVSVLDSLPSQMPAEIAKYTSMILDRAPKQVFDTVEHLAQMHISAYMCQGLWEKSTELVKHYEAKFIKLPKNSPFRNHALSSIYLCWGYLRALLCITDEQYDFDVYFEKYFQYAAAPFDPVKSYNAFSGAWLIAVGSSEKGAPEKYIDALNRVTSIVEKYLNGRKAGIDELARGELKYYQGDLHSSESMVFTALEQARGEHRQFEIIDLALFYILRLSIAHGDYQKAENALKEMKKQQEDAVNAGRTSTYDLAVCWYYCVMGMPEKTPSWLKENFSPYSHPVFFENFGNQVKTWFFYKTRNYYPLLSYIEEMKRRESFLFGRIEMLAMEACVYYKMKENKSAFAALQAAYDNASPNDIVMPFIELGKDMRTLTAAALKKPSACKIPKPWLENIHRKSTSYAKYQFHIITEYKQANSIQGGVTLSPREREILKDLSLGLSRNEIAASRGLSINTVKMVIHNVYMKLGAKNIAEAIRIAAERKIV